LRKKILPLQTENKSKWKTFIISEKKKVFKNG